MTRIHKIAATIVAIVIGVSLTAIPVVNEVNKRRPTGTPTLASTAPLKVSPTRTRTLTWTPSATPLSSLSPSSSPTSSATSPEGATATPTLETTSTPSHTPTAYTPIAPYVDAPLCTEHDTYTFHTLWNDALGCHYDHEHGTSPFTSEVANAFPGFDLYALLGNVQVGHTNPSSPMENTHKHGGMKWNVQLHHPETCAGFESAVTGVDGSVVQYHGFGDYAIEAEARLHSTVALLRQCRTTNPSDYGYVFINQLQDYGQRIVPYQGTIVEYPNQPTPAYPSPRGPYLSMDCIDLVEPHVTQCRQNFGQALQSGASSVWTSKVTGTGHSVTPPLFRLLWRVRDTYRLFDWGDLSYPFTFYWICGESISTYVAVGCEFNNTTTQVHEVGGVIPEAWDNLADWDTNPAIGRITAEGYIDGQGDINTICTEAGLECYPIKLINAFTGTYGSVLVYTGSGKGTNVVPLEPKRDIYFCAGVVCEETDAGATPSGWVGQEN